MVVPIPVVPASRIGPWRHGWHRAPGTAVALSGDSAGGGLALALDPYFPSKERLGVAARHYAGDTALQHPLVSPHYAPLHQLPPALIHVGTLEALLDDSLMLAERMNAQGSSASLKVFPGMWHVWQTLGGRMREADQSVDELGAFLRAHLQP